MSDCLHEFAEALNGGGGPFAECRCGRTHEAVEGDLTDPLDADELQQKRDRAKKHPDQYVLHEDVDCVTYKQFGFMTIVEDCPCKTLETLEEMLWSERFAIRQFFTNRVARMVVETDREQSSNIVMHAPQLNAKADF